MPKFTESPPGVHDLSRIFLCKLGTGSRGFHFLHTEAGDFRLDAPVNKRVLFMSAMAVAAGGATKASLSNLLALGTYTTPIALLAGGVSAESLTDSISVGHERSLRQ